MVDIPEPYKRLEGEDVPSLRKLAEPKSLKPVSNLIVGYDRIRPAYVWISLGLSMLMIVAGMMFMAHPMTYSQTYHVRDSLPPQYQYHLSYSMEKGEQLLVTGYVTGGRNDIWVYVKGKKGKVADFGKVRSPLNVKFIAPENGNYTLYLDNSISLLTTKNLNLDITYKYHDYFLAWLFLFTGVVAILLDFIAIIVGVKVLVLKLGSEEYRFWFNKMGLKPFLNVAVNGIRLNVKLRPGDKFRIGPEDNHLLEVVKASWRKWAILIDGREVGRLP